jgi:phenylalanyl-tRNA synthetase beta chain
MGIDYKSLRLSPLTETDLFCAGFDVADRSGKQLGVMAIVSRQILHRCDIDAPVYFAEFDRKAISRLALRHKVSYTPLPKTQPVRRDLALLIDRDVTLAQIEAAANEGERKLLRDFWLFDVYEGKNLPEGKKSYAVAMTLQDDENTLTDRRIDDAMARITAAISRRTGATLR